MKTTNLILFFIGLTTLIFTGIMIWTFWMMGSVPDTLITMWFTYILGECGVMGLIKSVKTIAAKQAESDKRKAEDLAKMSTKEAGK